MTHNTRENRIKRLLKREHVTEILFHHRFPTSTDNVRNACHPFSTKDTFKHNYVLVHNGVLINDDLLKHDHDQQGIKYISLQPNGQFNDSEALLYDVALYLEGEQTEITAMGDIAFICIESDETGKAIKLHFARNSGSPLNIQFLEDSLAISSEGEGDPIQPNMLYSYEYATQELVTQDLTIPEWRTQQIGYQYQSREEYEFQNFGHTARTTFPDGSTDLFEMDQFGNWSTKKPSEYGGKGYYEGLVLEGYNLATQLMDDFGYDLETIADEIENMMDSTRGKIMRLSKRIANTPDTSSKKQRLGDERKGLWRKEEVLQEAVDFLTDWEGADTLEKETLLHG